MGRRGALRDELTGVDLEDCGFELSLGGAFERTVTTSGQPMKSCSMTSEKAEFSTRLATEEMFDLSFFFSPPIQQGDTGNWTEGRLDVLYEPVENISDDESWWQSDNPPGVTCTITVSINTPDYDGGFGNRVEGTGACDGPILDSDQLRDALEVRAFRFKGNLGPT